MEMESELFALKEKVNKLEHDNALLSRDRYWVGALAAAIFAWLGFTSVHTLPKEISEQATLEVIKQMPTAVSQAMTELNNFKDAAARAATEATNAADKAKESLKGITAKDSDRWMPGGGKGSWKLTDEILIDKSEQRCKGGAVVRGARLRSVDAEKQKQLGIELLCSH